MNSLVKTCENRIVQPIEREGFLNPFRFKAFTLTELIVVVTILAILGLISFIYIQGYTQEARDAKRLSDLRSLAGKVVIEQTKGANLEDLENREETIIVKINQEEKESNIGFLNREALREPSENFRDPLTGEEYKFAYSKGTINETESYSFIQFKGLKEVGGEDLFVGNYFQYANGDSPSLFEGAVANLPDPCSLGQYADISCWNRFKSEVAIYTDDTFLSATTFGSLSGNDKWVGGVLAPNGKIYGMPFNAETILSIDLETKTIATIPSLPITGIWKSIGGVLASNGKIYWVPANATRVLKMDPETNIMEAIGPTLNGEHKRAGGVLAPNGYIYGVPYRLQKLLKINTETDEVTELSNDLGYFTMDGWHSGLLASNGKIYLIPFDATSILEIDPETDMISSFGTFPSGGYKRYGGVMATNGKIYCIPFKANKVLEINPDTKETREIGIDLGTGSDKWNLGVLASNGKIYGIPRSSSHILEINPETGTTQLIGPALNGNYKWAGGVLASNGKIYGIPYYSTSVLEISFSTDRDLNIEPLLGSYVNNN